MSDPHETLARIRAQAEKATEGPWEVGDRYHCQSADKCDCRPDYGPLVDTYQHEAWGAMHVHRADEPWWNEGVLFREPGAPPGEVGREIIREDSEFIAAARTTVPALLDALEKVLELHRPVGEEVIPWDCAEGDCDHEDDEHPLDTVTLCGECYRLAVEVSPYYGENGCSAVLWPCPTVKAITDALDTNH